MSAASPNPLTVSRPTWIALAFVVLGGLNLAQGTGDKTGSPPGKDAGAVARQWKAKHSISIAGMASGIAFSPDGKTFVTGSDSAKEKYVRFWDTETGKELFKLSVQSPALKFTPDGKVLAMGIGREVLLWNVKEKKEAKRLPGFSGAVNSLDISSDGKMLAACDRKLMQVFDLETGKAILADRQPGRTLNAVAFSPDSARLALGYGDEVTQSDPGELDIWNVPEKKLLHRLPEPAGEIITVAFVGGSEIVATGGISNQKRGPPKGGTFLWDFKSGKKATLFPEHKFYTWTIAFSAKEKLLASGGDDGMIHFWNSTTRKFVQSIKTDVGDVLSMTFSADGAYFAVGGRDGKVQLFSRP